jgi:ABC-type bacteriocin/lantibiotic exporter with double-glycine peptidase domain
MTIATSIALEVENVSFTFPDSKNKILNNIKTLIKANVSLLTEQTVLEDNLDTHIVRLIQPNQGAISINDNSFKKINLNQFRSQIESIIWEKLHLKGLCLKILL